MSESNLSADPLFVGLTRPSMVFGVSLPFLMLNSMISMVVFVQTSNFRVILLSAAIHLVGYLMCFREPRFMEIYMNKVGKCPSCPNKSFYGANSYSV